MPPTIKIVVPTSPFHSSSCNEFLALDIGVALRLYYIGFLSYISISNCLDAADDLSQRLRSSSRYLLLRREMKVVSYRVGEFHGKDSKK
jgi:hypothetical protein